MPRARSQEAGNWTPPPSLHQSRQLIHRVAGRDVARRTTGQRAPDHASDADRTGARSATSRGRRRRPGPAARQATSSTPVSRTAPAAQWNQPSRAAVALLHRLLAPVQACRLGSQRGDRALSRVDGSGGSRPGSGALAKAAARAPSAATRMRSRLAGSSPAPARHGRSRRANGPEWERQRGQQRLATRASGSRQLAVAPAPAEVARESQAGSAEPPRAERRG